MPVFSKILKLSHDNGIGLVDFNSRKEYLSVRLIKDAGATTYTQSSKDTNILLNGNCIDKESRCLYLFYIDKYLNTSWILEVNIDTRNIIVVYYDRDNSIGFNPNYKIFNPRIVGGKLIWTNGLNPIYQMDIARAKKSFLNGIGYDPYPNVSEWNSVRNYFVGEIISRGNSFYKCLILNTNQDPILNLNVWQNICLLKDAYYSMKIENFYFAPKPPALPPVVVYQQDSVRKINNLKQTLFQFAYNYIYMDYRESTYSPACIVPLPQSEEEFTSGQSNEDLTINNQLKITVNTGGEEVRKIRIIGRSNQDPSKWWLVDEIDKFEEGESFALGSVISIGGMLTAEVNTLTINVPQPIQFGSSLTLSEYDILTLGAIDPTAANFYIEASDDNMYWYYNEFIP
jgi:hypothetical protein